MRVKLVLISSFCLVSTAALAQNYNVQPAPSSWNVPQTAPQTQTAPQQDDMIEVDMGATAARPSATRSANPATLNEAVSCAAVLQIAALAAPSWSNEHGVANATNLWLERVFTLADASGVSGDQVNNLVKTEMERQTNSSVSNPTMLNTKAFDCASNLP